MKNTKNKIETIFYLFLSLCAIITVSLTIWAVVSTVFGFDKGIKYSEPQIEKDCAPDYMGGCN